MAEVDDQNEKQKKGNGYEENVPSSKILKLAIVAALVIVIIALVLYLKARHQPPALRNQLEMTPVRLDARLGATVHALNKASGPLAISLQETIPWTPQQTANPILS
ncbi:MAG TPA: hypothetical protein VJN90_00900 [Candidatus Acidoferrales bacterium]|nr:hypothetical protein [Candidatus Acidoferrales bacterium]